jgi:hypothetical protein
VLPRATRVQALIRINERKATIVCRAEDLSLVKQVVGAAKSKFEEEAKNSGLIYMQDVAQGIDVAVHESTFLAPAPVAGSGEEVVLRWGCRAEREQHNFVRQHAGRAPEYCV